MKIRKLLSSLMSVAMISTLLSAFTVAQAASTPTMTATATFDEAYQMIAVTVSYSGMDDLAPNSGNALLKTLTGINAMSFSVGCDNSDLAFVAGLSSNSNVTVSTVQPTAAVNISSIDQLITDKSGDLATFYYSGSKDAVAKFEVVDPIIQVKAYVANKLQSTTEYTGEQITCVGATYGSSAPVLADFTALNAAIAAYEAKNEADYTSESWAVAKAAYDTAKAIDQAAETDQDKVNAAATALSNAIAALELKPVDKVTVTPDERSEKKDNASGLWTYGFSGTVTTTGSASYSRLIFNFKDGDKQGKEPYIWEVGTSLNTPITYGLNIWGCPVGSDVTATVTAE